MANENLVIVQENPNDQVGGGGCLCGGDTNREDCTGPYAVFPATETDSASSPHSVLSLACAQAFVERASGEVLRPTSDRLRDAQAENLTSRTPDQVGAPRQDGQEISPPPVLTIPEEDIVEL